ncbi:MAG: thiamine pyrophosphate-binding protein [Chloroflexota bacterium]|nr:thiamine pyrophosphate-binding protein [Chloroflexota bacterium]
MKVYEALANAFVKEGVTTVFGLMGNGNMYWWHTLDQHPDVTVHETRHEGTALTMAEGWARASGQPGICTVTQGPGLTQLSTSLTVAVRAKVPMVVFAGDTALNDHDSVQQLDQAKFVDATGAGFVPLWSAEGTDDAVRQAFYLARTESRPIVLNAPMDVQQQAYDGEGDEYQPSTTLLPGRQRVQPDPDQLRDAVRAIAESRKPVIVAGLGAAKAEAGEAITRLADRIGALLATTLPMKGWLGESEYHVGVSGLYATKTAIELFAQADCVIGVGASLNHYTTEHGYIFPNARYVQIDLKPSIVMGNGKRADHYLQADARLAVESIERHLADQGVAGSGFRTAEVRAMLSEYDPDPREFELDPGTVDPRRVAAILDERLPSEIGVVHGTGHCSGITAIFMRKPRKLTWAINTFGCIGQAFPTALGAAVALDGAPLAVVDGDASMLMHASELDTAARLGVKLLVAVFNDEALGAEYQKFVSKKMDARASAIPTPDLGVVARAFGCRGKQARTLEDVQDGIDEFLAGDGPMVLDIRVSRSVVSVPYSRLWFGEDV